jgi:hypothetical protein
MAAATGEPVMDVEHSQAILSILPLNLGYYSEGFEPTEILRKSTYLRSYFRFTDNHAVHTRALISLFIER